MLQVPSHVLSPVRSLLELLRTPKRCWAGAGHLSVVLSLCCSALPRLSSQHRGLGVISVGSSSPLASPRDAQAALSPL